jgi:2-iminobutanoate/2-iminopropanoate deaminase
MSLATIDVGIARQIGSYSDAVKTSGQLRWLVTSGTPGLALDGKLPDDVAGQADLAWAHIKRMLSDAQMDVGDIVKVTQYLTRAEDIPAYAAVRLRHLGSVRPASMLLVIDALVRPEFLVEVEVIAAKASTP